MLFGLSVIGMRLSALNLPFPHDPPAFLVKFLESGRPSPVCPRVLVRAVRNCALGT